MDKQLELALRILALANLSAGAIAGLIGKLRSNPGATTDELLAEAERIAKETITKGEDWLEKH